MHGWISSKGFKVFTELVSPSIRLFCGLGGNGRRLHRDSYGYTRLLQSCSEARSLNQIHSQIIIDGYEQNPFLAAKLISRYTELGSQSMEDARRVFDSISERDILLWNVMIRAYANSGPSSEAIVIYDQMRRSTVLSNCYTYPFVLKACGALGDVNKGREIHAHVLRAALGSDLFVGNALVAFYAKCGEVRTARKLFDKIPIKDLVSWNSMIAGYSQNNHAFEALVLLHRMLRGDTVSKPDCVTLVALLPACATLAAVQEGMWAHSYVVKTGIEVDAGLGSGLIAMYASCGHLETAREVFARISDKNLVVWNAMIRGYGMHGHASEALGLFSEMLETGVNPDGICFICMLSACSHVGMVDKGWEIFEMMGKCGVEKSEVHYACMVDMLGRSGQLSEAVEFISRMPMKPGKDVWGAMLGACRIHNDIALAEEVAQRLFLLDPENAGRYTILAKMYEDVGRWEDAARVRKAMRDRGVRKPLGCSMVEVDSQVHMFGVEDESHPMTPEIYDVLEHLQRVVEVAAMG